MEALCIHISGDMDTKHGSTGAREIHSLPRTGLSTHQLVHSAQTHHHKRANCGSSLAGASLHTLPFNTWAGRLVIPPPCWSGWLCGEVGKHQLGYFHNWHVRYEDRCACWLVSGLASSGERKPTSVSLVVLHFIFVPPRIRIQSARA